MKDSFSYHSSYLHPIFSTIYFEKGAGVVGAVGKISTFRPQGPRFDPNLFRDLNICATFFSAYANSAFHPSWVGK